jgi:predicted amidohydrolase
MKVTIGQINSTNGDITGNVRKIVEAIEKAKSDGSDLIVFPEVITHGYTSQDWFQDPDIIEHSLDPLDDIMRATDGITAVVGTIRPNNDNDGRRLYNCAAVLSNGELVAFVDKTLLPEYDVFDDPRYFEPEKNPNGIVEIVDREGHSHRIGVVVCEDFWNDKTFWEDRLYDNDPTDVVIEHGADLIVSINASPYNKGKIKLRCDMVAHRARNSRVPIVFVNLIGGNDGIVFDGASLIADQQGDIILQAAAFEEFVETVELDVGKPDARGISGAECEAIRQALVLGIRDYARKNGFKKVLLGLSGGIDSSLVAALAAEAVGPENLLCVMMPSPFSSEGSVKDSEELIRNLGCEARLEPISDTFEVLLKQMKLNKPTKGGESLAAENMQSRLRGVILMAISNAEGRPVTFHREQIRARCWLLHFVRRYERRTRRPRRCFENRSLGHRPTHQRVGGTRDHSEQDHRQETVSRARTEPVRSGQPSAVRADGSDPQTLFRTQSRTRRDHRRRTRRGSRLLCSQQSRESGERIQAPAAPAVDHHLEERDRRRPPSSDHSQVPPTN